MDDNNSYTITLDGSDNMATTIDSSYYGSDILLTGGIIESSQINWATDTTINTSNISWSSENDRLKVLEKTIDEIKHRLCILEPNFELHDKFPMLKELYDQYRALEKILNTPDSDED